MKNQLKLRDIYFFLFSISILVLLIFPVYSLGNRLEPMFLGLPFSLAWIIFCIILQFVGILFFLFTEKEKN